MKKLIAAILSITISLVISGCTFSSDDQGNTTTLYYIRSEYQYYSTDNVIVGEDRIFVSRPDAFDQLLDLYLAGPLDDGLISPLPRGTHLVDIQEYSGLLEITLSDTENALSDAEFSLACVCIGKTIMEDSDIIQITVFSGERSMTVNRTNYLLNDESHASEVSKEVQP